MPDAREMLDSIQAETDANSAPVETGTAETGSSTQSTKTEPQKSWWVEKIKDEVEYTANGKPIREPLEMVLKRASQGFNYSQHMDDFNKKIAEFEQNRQKWEAINKKWEPYEQYAQQNPDYNKFLEEQWAKRDAWQQGLLADPDNPMTSVVLKLQEQIESLKNDFGSKFESFQAQKEETALDNEIKSVKTNFNDIDFDQRDEFGKTLEFRVLEHATKNGIKTFGAAFKDFYHDELIKRAESRTKEQLLKDARDKKAAGIIGGKPTPASQNANQNVNHKNLSYDQLSKIAIQELQNSGMN